MDTDYRPHHARKRSSSARPRMQRGQSTNGAAYSVDTLDAKVVILGRQGVGKTSLVRRYTSNTFHPPSTQSTTGAFFVTKKCTLDGVGVRLQIWDTAGQERFRSMAPMYIRGAHAAVVVYDLTSEQSFEDVRGWIDELKKSTPPETLLYVVGSKSDLCPPHRAVTPSHARASLLRWYPPPPPPTTPRPSPPRRPRLISLPTSLPMSRSTPALAQFPSTSRGQNAFGSTSGPPTPGAGAHGPLTAPVVGDGFWSYAPARPRLASSPSTPAPGLRMTNGHANGHAHADGHGHGHDRKMIGSGLANGNGNGHQYARSYATRPGRAWSWGSSPDEKDESPTFQRQRTSQSHIPRQPHASSSYDPSPDRGRAFSSSSAPDSPEDDETTSSDDEEAEAPEDRRGNWELFEVSAKDDVGVAALFTSLIRALLSRRGEIQYERELRSRGSVMLRGSEGGAAVGGAGKPGEDGEEPKAGWGCCGV